MAVRVLFEGLVGVDDGGGPVCSLLSIDGVNVLLDVGWSLDFNEEAIEPLKRVAPSIDVVLLSHADMDHIGALPFFLTKLGVKPSIIVLATFPVHSMGQMTLYDAHLSRSTTSKFDLFSLDDIDVSFKVVEYGGPMRKVTFFEEVLVQGIKFTAHPAGRTIGGAVWRVVKGAEDIVYAVDYNHRNDRHVGRTKLGNIKKPTILITDSKNAMTETPKSVDDEFLNAVRSCVVTSRGVTGGNVLIPTDTACRVLELMLRLDEIWDPKTMGSLVMLNFVATHTINYGMTLKEFLFRTLIKQLRKTGKKPFEFKHGKLCMHPDDLADLPRPLTVLASSPSLDHGFSFELFLSWASDRRSTILLTERPHKDSLAHRLLALRRGEELTVEVTSLVKTSASAEDIRRASEMKRALQAEQDEMKMDLDELLEEDAVGTPHPDPSTPAPATPKAAATSATPATAPLFKLLYPMFSHTEPKPTLSEYGVALDPAMFKDSMAVAPSASLTAPVAGVGAGGAGGAGGAAATAGAGAEAEKEEGLWLMKTESEERSIRVNCRVMSVDLEGRADGRSSVALLESVSAHTVVLVHGTPESSQYMRSQCARYSETFVLPAAATPVEVSSHTSIVEARIADELFKGLQFNAVGAGAGAGAGAVGGGAGAGAGSGGAGGDDRLSYSVAYVDGVWRKVDGSAASAVGADLVLCPDDDAMSGHTPSLLRTEPLRMHFVKRALARADVTVTQGKGVLVTGGGVVIRRDPTSPDDRELILEGPVGPEYFTVRNILYGLYSSV